MGCNHSPAQSTFQRECDRRFSKETRHVPHCKLRFATVEYGTSGEVEKRGETCKIERKVDDVGLVFLSVQTGPKNLMTSSYFAT